MEKILAALIFDILSLLAAHKDFFERSLQQRKALLEEKKLLPSAVAEYLVSVDAESFQKEMALVVRYVTTFSSQLVKPEGKIFEAVAVFVAGELAELVDRLPELEIPYDGIFGKELKSMLAGNLSQEIMAMMEDFLRSMKDVPLIYVQLAREVGPELKVEMRKVFREKYPLSLPVFSVNRDLIGGCRIFIDGKTMDYSWLAKIDRITRWRPVKAL